MASVNGIQLHYVMGHENEVNSTILAIPPGIDNWPINGMYVI
jgi:hypothetical protein